MILFDNRERQIVGASLAFRVFFSAYDLFEDATDGLSLFELAGDLIGFLISAGLLLYIYILQPATARRQNVGLTAETTRQKQDLKLLSGIAKKHLDGLSIYIDQQFEHWELTHAEKEVALLLLKGLSLKEIATLRNITERTARQQATTVYGKAGLSGRAELSAFFLEDLLLPGAAVAQE